MKHIFALLTYLILICGFGCSNAFAQTTNQVVVGNSGDGITVDPNYLWMTNAERPINSNYVSVTGGSLDRWSKAIDPTNVILGQWSFKWTTANSGEIMKFKIRDLPMKVKGTQCYAYFNYQYATVFGIGESAFKTYVVDGSATKITPMDEVLTSTYDSSGSNSGLSRRVNTKAFDCSKAMTDMELWIEHTTSTTTVFTSDELRLIEYDGRMTVPQGTQFVGSIKWANTLNCGWSYNAVTWGNFSADTDCPTPTVKGSVAAPGTKIPAVVLAAGSPAGRYVFTATAGFIKGGTLSELVGFRFSDGTNNSSGQSIFSTTIPIQTPVIMGEITYNTALASSTTVNIQGRTTSTSTTAVIDASSSGILDLEITVIRYPLNGTYDNVFPASLADTSRQLYTPIFTGFGTVTVHECYQWLQGEFGYIDCKFTSPGGTATEAGVSLPTSWPATSTFANGIHNASNGVGIFSFTTGSILVPLIESGASYLTFGLQSASSAGLTKVNGSSTTSGATTLAFLAKVPLQNRIPNNGAFVGPGIPFNSSTSNWKQETITVAGATDIANCTTSPCKIYNASLTGVNVTRTGTGVYPIVWSPNAGWNGNNYSCAPLVFNWSSGSVANCFITSKTAAGFTLNCNANSGAVDAAFILFCGGPK